jgi:hypothetical protein
VLELAPAFVAKARQILKEIRRKLGKARRWAVLTAFLGLLGGYLQILAYVWGTAVLLSGLVDLISDWDYWVVTWLVLVGSVVLLAVRATNQVHQGWFAGYYRDGFSGYVLPQFETNCDAPENEGQKCIVGVYVVTKYLPFVLGLAGIGVSVWRMCFLWGMGNCRTYVSLWLFYVALALSCLLFLLMQALLLMCVNGDTNVLPCKHEQFEDGCSFEANLVLGRQYPVHAAAAALTQDARCSKCCMNLCGLLCVCCKGGAPQPAVAGVAADVQQYGLRRKMTRYHFEHIHAAAVAGGMWQGLTHATPIAYLLHEYYFSRNKELEPSNFSYSENLFYIIQLFYEHGTALEKYMVERWKAGEYSSDVMLVISEAHRPGPWHAEGHQQGQQRGLQLRQ